MIHFETELLQINDWLIIRLPENVSEQMPSRGMVMLKGDVNGVNFVVPVEPDGWGSHWFRINQTLANATGIQAGDMVSLQVSPLDTWLAPELPQDFADALALNDLLVWWDSLTMKARWAWIRWIRSTRSEKTRRKRIDASVSKMVSGMKRPCCFNASLCTEMNVCRSGKLELTV